MAAPSLPWRLSTLSERVVLYSHLRFLPTSHASTVSHDAPPYAEEERGSAVKVDAIGRPLSSNSIVTIPPFMPCG